MKGSPGDGVYSVEIGLGFAAYRHCSRETPQRQEAASEREAGPERSRRGDHFPTWKRERLSQLAFPLVGDIEARGSCPGEKSLEAAKQRRGRGLPRTCRERTASEEAPVGGSSADRLG